MQFLLVSFWCIFLARLAQGSPWLRENVPVLKNGIRKPNKEIIMATLPLTAFQIGGHILNSDAMSKIPVSLVHTIKGLSPLMTVVACRIFFQVKYSVPTYLSLVPLTIGVILACSASFQGNFLGFLYAFASAILFVTQNIVSKKLFTDSARAEADGVPLGRRKPDKLNLLCYSSAMALIFTFPIWLWSEGFAILADLWSDGSIDLRYWKPGSLDHGRLTLEFFFNGTFHFGQSLVAFVLLGLTSPVTYSVASLIKRVVVIMFAIVWFGNPMTRVQGFGFLLTFLGLYLYDRTSDAAKQDKRAREKDAANDHLLPLSMGDAKKDDDAGATGPPFAQSPGTTNGNGDGYHGSNHGDYAIGLGTRAHETWNENDKAWQQPVVR
jgi:solute carrier family 35 protein E1